MLIRAEHVSAFGCGDGGYVGGAHTVKYRLLIGNIGVAEVFCHRSVSSSRLTVIGDISDIRSTRFR